MALLQFILIGNTVAFSLRGADLPTDDAAAPPSVRRLLSTEAGVSVFALMGTFVFLVILLSSLAVSKRSSRMPALKKSRRGRLIEAMHLNTVAFQKVVVREFEIHDGFLQVLDNYVTECTKAMVSGLTKEFKAKLATYNEDWDNFCDENKLRFANLQRLDLLKNDFKVWHWMPPFYRISYEDIYECNINRHLVLKLLFQVAESRTQLYKEIAPNDVPPSPQITEDSYADVMLGIEFLRQMEQMTHPLLDRVDIVPHSVLEVEEKASPIKPGQQVRAVVVDVAGFKHLVQNTTADASKCSAAVYDWLKVKTFPDSVHAYFSRGDPTLVTREKTEGNAYFHSYAYEKWVIHAVASTNAHNVSKTVEGAAKMYENILQEYCLAINRGDIPRDTPLRIPIDEIVVGKKYIKPHVPLIILSALSLALIRMPQEQMIADFPDGKFIQLCTRRVRECALYENKLAQKLKFVRNAPCVDETTLNALPMKGGSHKWIREANTGADRLERLSAMFTTQACIRNGGYSWNRFHDDHDVSRSSDKVLELLTNTQIPGIQSMIDGTRFFKESEAKKFLSANERPTTRTLYSRVENMDARFVTIMEIAAIKTNQGYRVAAINAASAYHCGGGVMTGGRHALEEAWCMTSTLLRSLLKSTYMAHHGDSGNPVAGRSARTMKRSESYRSNPQHVQLKKQHTGSHFGKMIYDLVRGKKTDISELVAHIPVDGCILSPDVALFRNETDNGYEFLRSPALLAGVVSLAAFNKNKRVADSPIDAPENEEDYLDQVKAKWMAAVVGAKVMQADVLVIPDVGCGVFMNDPEKVGQMLNDVLMETHGFFKEVIVMGDEKFQKAALKGMKNSVVMTLSEEKTDWDAKQNISTKVERSMRSVRSSRSKRSSRSRKSAESKFRAMNVSIGYQASGQEAFTCNPPDHPPPSNKSISEIDLTASVAIGSFKKNRHSAQAGEASAECTIVPRKDAESAPDGTRDHGVHRDSARRQGVRQRDSGQRRGSGRISGSNNKQRSRNELLHGDGRGENDGGIALRPSKISSVVRLAKSQGEDSPVRLALCTEKEIKPTSTTSEVHESAASRPSSKLEITEASTGSVILSTNDRADDVPVNDATRDVSISADGLIEVTRRDLALEEDSPKATSDADAL